MAENSFSCSGHQHNSSSLSSQLDEIALHASLVRVSEESEVPSDLEAQRSSIERNHSLPFRAGNRINNKSSSTPNDLENAAPNELLSHAEALTVQSVPSSCPVWDSASTRNPSFFPISERRPLLGYPAPNYTATSLLSWFIWTYVQTQLNRENMSIVGLVTVSLLSLIIVCLTVLAQLGESWGTAELKRRVCDLELAWIGQDVFGVCLQDGA